MFRRPSALTGFWIVTSAIWIRPPGVRTRKISAKTASLSGIRSMTPFEITTSKLVSGNGSCSASLSTNSSRRVHLGCRGARFRQHLRGHVDAGDGALVADHLRGDERVGAGAGAEVEHP